MLLTLLSGGGHYRDDIPPLVVDNGAGFSRGEGNPDLSTIIAQVYEFMRDSHIYFPFHGKYYDFTYWQLFVTMIVIWLVVDIICMGWRLLNRNQLVYWEE